jgi:hypothetical protein
VALKASTQAALSKATGRLDSSEACDIINAQGERGTQNRGVTLQNRHAAPEVECGYVRRDMPPRLSRFRASEPSSASKGSEACLHQDERLP